MAKKLSWRNKNSNKKIFVGRKEQLDLFQNNIDLGPNDDDFQNIFNVYGQGGVGKSTLLGKYLDISNRKDYVSVFIDTEDKRIYDVLATMNAISVEFGKQSFPFEKFDKTYKKYLQETKKLESDPEKPAGFLGALISGGLKGGAEIAADMVPGGNMAKKIIPTDAIADNLGKWADFAWKKLKNKDEVELVLEPLKVLSPLWLEGLAKCMSKKNIALFFDTYEAVNPMLNQWITDIITEYYGDFPSNNFLLVIGGRDQISKNEKWTDLKDYIEEIGLEALSEEEAISYLNEAKITNPDTIKFILEASSCLPVYLTMLSEGNPDSPEAVGDPKEQIVARFLKHIKDPVKRQLALSAALAQRIDKDIIECLLPKDEKSKALDFFNWIKDRPFIHKIEGKWAYHPIVREIMLKYQKETSQKDWEKLHNGLAQFYKDRMNNTGLKDRIKQFENQEFSYYHLEYNYHKLSANYTKFIPDMVRDFVTILVNNKSAYASRPLVKTLLKVELLCIYFEWGKILEEGSAEFISNGKRGIKAKRLINKIMDSNFIEDKNEKGFLYTLLGGIFFNEYDYDSAIEACRKAIKLVPNNPKDHFNLGTLLSRKENYKEAIIEYNKVIKLKPDYAKVYLNLGFSLRKINDYKGAITAYNKAINLMPNDVKAYISLGFLFLAIRKIKEAKEQLEKALKLSVKNEFAFMNLGHVFLIEGDGTKAKDYYSKSRDLYQKKEDFFGGMESDYLDIDMEKQGVDKIKYEGILDWLKEEGA